MQTSNCIKMFCLALMMNYFFDYFSTLGQGAQVFNVTASLHTLDFSVQILSIRVKSLKNLAQDKW
jgi:hypothetical protein